MKAQDADAPINQRDSRRRPSPADARVWCVTDRGGQTMALRAILVHRDGLVVFMEPEEPFDTIVFYSVYGFIKIEQIFGDDE